ncbi:glycosyltransferase 87 family protein [Lishizhenia sp.]|uniref:glycosyltransferase 87 family protein n=1 Tax=Lishizhenia sp. TaxID=2497594 RepID=UPI00299D9670|nr:glycosyltransferase 87 family protein [Lishizhenia sp.]MDX1446800.1 glycosyltransferase 87 family protein [Lishizhenia sp.]
MQWKKWFWVLGYFVAVLGLGRYAQQDNFITTFSSYTFAFAFYLGIYFKRKMFSPRELKITVFISAIIVLPFLPGLSPDYFRFLWDGRLILDGINPYAHTPEALMEMSRFANDAYYQELYAGITQLSKENYSCYPSINQFYFAAANLFSKDVWFNMVMMRILIILSLLFAHHFTVKMLLQFDRSPKLASLFFLNPFVLLELIINLHFEGVMIAFFAPGLFYLLRDRMFLSALFFALAINVKLTPLLLLPFIYKQLSIRHTVLFYFYTLVGVHLFTHLLLWPPYYENFAESLSLYFSNFEFNSSLYSTASSLFYPLFTWETVYIVGPALSMLTLGLIIVMALKRPVNTSVEILYYMMAGYFIYLLLSSTVHPWYLSIPLFLGMFSKFNFVVIWSFVVILSYGFYAFESPWIATTLKWTEYGIVFIYLLWEILKIRRVSIQ